MKEMTLRDIMKSKERDLSYIPSLLAATGKVAYPYSKNRRDHVLSNLENMNQATQDKIDSFVSIPHGLIFKPDGFTAVELYMLGQRYACAHSFLSDVVESEPFPNWISVSDSSVATQDTFLYKNIWSAFGQQWLASLAWRLVKGHEQ